MVSLKELFAGSGQERRLLPRKKHKMPVLIRIQSGLTQTGPFNGETIDVSVRSMLCGVTKPIPASAIVEVEFPQLDFEQPASTAFRLQGRTTRCLPWSQSNDNWGHNDFAYEVTVYFEPELSEHTGMLEVWGHYVRELAS